MRRRHHAPRRWWFLRTGLPGHLDFLPVRHGLPLLACGAIWGGTHLWRVRRPPMSVVWNEVDEHGKERVNRIDRRARDRLRWRDPMKARSLSNLMAHGIVPGGVWGLAIAAGLRGGGGPLADVLIAHEAAVYAGTLSQLAKLAFRRQRPFSRFTPPTDAARHPDDDNLSFFSSHTAITSAFAFAVAEIANRRAVRTPLTLLLAACAGFTGYLRIAADRHYLSDVITGALVGASVGTWGPRLLHPVRAVAKWRRLQHRVRNRVLALASVVSRPAKSGVGRRRRGELFSRG